MSGFTDRFGAVARDYARYRPRYPRALFDLLAARSAGHTLAWDCACGTGQATIGLAERYSHVLATDASAAQLAQAPVVANVEWRVARAEDSGLPSASVDLVCVAQALHWLPYAAFYAEVDRVLRPGGVLAVVCYGRMTVDAPAVQAYRDVPQPYPLEPTPALEMIEDWQALALLGYLRSWSATTAFIAARAYDPVNALVPVLAQAWPASAESVRIRWPLQVLLGRKPASTTEYPA